MIFLAPKQNLAWELDNNNLCQNYTCLKSFMHFLGHYLGFNLSCNPITLSGEIFKFLKSA